jgi:hypothetical protein
MAEKGTRLPIQNFQGCLLRADYLPHSIIMNNDRDGRTAVRQANIANGSLMMRNQPLKMFLVIRPVWVDCVSSPMSAVGQLSFFAHQEIFNALKPTFANRHYRPIKDTHRCQLVAVTALIS